MLTGSSSLGDLLYAAKSFVERYRNPVTLVIHGDGTLSASDKERLAGHLPEGEILLKEERDKKTIPYLKKHDLEHCRAFREANVFGRRLVDTSVLSKGRMVINMDTDCLSFDTLGRLRSLVEEEAITYIQDPKPQPFSLSSQEAKRRFEVKPIRHFNAGLCAFPSAQLDLEQIETWLTRPGYPMESHYAEQTILAALAALGKSKALPRKEYTFGRRSTETVRFVHYADHYLSKTRISMRRDGQKEILRQLEKATE